MEWHVKLKGTSDLERLSKFTKLSNCLIAKKGNEYILKSPLFTELEGAHDVDVKAEEIISYINAIAAFLFDFESPVRSYTIASIDDTGKETQFILPKPVELKIRVGIPTILINGVVQGTTIEDKYIDLFNLVFVDEDVHDLFSIIRDDNNWYELYGIYEIIERNVKDQKKLLELSGLTSSNQLQDLTKTMNMHRHTRKKPMHRHPENPYSVKEARQVIRKLVNNWIDAKLRKSANYDKV